MSTKKYSRSISSSSQSRSSPSPCGLGSPNPVNNSNTRESNVIELCCFFPCRLGRCRSKIFCKLFCSRASSSTSRVCCERMPLNPPSQIFSMFCNRSPRRESRASRSAHHSLLAPFTDMSRPLCVEKLLNSIISSSSTLPSRKPKTSSYMSRDL